MHALQHLCLLSNSPDNAFFWQPSLASCCLRSHCSRLWPQRRSPELCASRVHSHSRLRASFAHGHICRLCSPLLCSLCLAALCVPGLLLWLFLLLLLLTCRASASACAFAFSGPRTCATPVSTLAPLHVGCWHFTWPPGTPPL